jgi:hypothetical protein
VDRNPFHPGAKLLRPFAETTANPTASDFEDEFLAFVQRYGLPTPQIRRGVNTVRITKQRMTQTPDREAARLNEILERR